MKWVLVAITAIVLVTVAAMAAMPWLVDTPRVQSLIASSVTHALARPVKFRSASVSLMPYPAVRLRGVEIAEDPAVGAGPFVRLDDADFRLKLPPLLRGHVEFTTLVLKRPTITLAHGPGGRWNFASLGAPRESATGPRPPRAGGGGGPSLLATRVIIDKGIVVYEGRETGSLAAGQRLEDVDATLSRRAGALSFNGSGRLVPAALRVTADGTIALGGARTFTEASLRARVEIDGEDVHPLAAAILGGAEPAIGGSLRGQLDVSGTLGRPRAAGEVEWRVPTVTRTSTACGEPRRRTLALATVKASVSWRDGRLIADPLTTGIPGGTATGTLTTETSPPARADLTGLALQRIPLERVLVDFLCQPYAVAGPLDLTGTLTLSPGDPLRTLSGRGRLHVGAGRVVGARALALFGGLARAGGGASPARGSDLPATLAAAPLEFDAIDGAFEIGNGVVTTRDLVYTSRLLTVRARGTYALPNDHLNADLVLEHARGTFQAKVTGSAEAPSIRAPQSFARHDADRADRGFKDLLKKFR